MSEPALAVSQVQALECLDVQGQGIRVEFQKHGDRFGHTILGVGEGEATPLLKSVEGTPDESAPPSPPFTELHQQGETIFLSGATTLGHWSMSVEVVEGRLLFDVACRAKKDAGGLGSMYHVLDANNTLEPGDITTSILADDKLHVTPASPAASDFPTTIRWRYMLVNKA